MGIKNWQKEKEMKQIIHSVLRELVESRQLNMESEGAREMVAVALEKELKVYVMNLIEDIVIPQKPYKHPNRS